MLLFYLFSFSFSSFLVFRLMLNLLFYRFFSLMLLFFICFFLILLLYFSRFIWFDCDFFSRFFLKWLADWLWRRLTGCHGTVDRKSPNDLTLLDPEANTSLAMELQLKCSKSACRWSVKLKRISFHLFFFYYRLLLSSSLSRMCFSPKSLLFPIRFNYTNWRKFFVRKIQN